MKKKFRNWLQFKINRNEVSDYELPEGNFLAAAKLIAADCANKKHGLIRSVTSTLRYFYFEKEKWNNRVIGYSESFN